MYKHAIVAGLSALLCTSNAVAQSENFPTSVVRIVIPFAPGGGTDVIARPFAQKFGEALKGTVILDNRPGGEGAIAASFVAKSRPDGHTLFLPSSAAVAINAVLFSKLPYDPVKDFAPISLITVVPYVLVANSALPVSSIKELIAYAKSNPGKLNWAYSASSTLMTTQLFRQMAGIEITTVPYKGAGPASAAILSGESNLVFQNPGVVLPHIKAGRLRALAVTGEKRLPMLSDVPTISEAGLVGFEGSGWYGLLAPKGTQGKIVNFLNKHVINALRSQEVRSIYASVGAVPVGNSPSQFADYIQGEIKTWRKVAKEAGIKPR